jgi:hypothetical protein
MVRVVVHHPSGSTESVIRHRTHRKPSISESYWHFEFNNFLKSYLL